LWRWLCIVLLLSDVKQLSVCLSIHLFGCLMHMLNNFISSVVYPGSDNKIFIWNVGTAEVVTEVELPDIALSASWSYNGSLFVVSCKDKKIRIIDPRSGTVVQVYLISVAFIREAYRATTVTANHVH